MCLYMYIVLTVSQFHTDVHLVYLVCFFCLTRQFYQKSWVWVICSDETSNQAKAKSLSNLTLPYSLLLCSISACSQHQYLLPWLNFSCVYHLTCRKKNKRKKEPFFSTRELLSTRKHWTINRHIAFIFFFQLKISTSFRKLSIKKYIASNNFLFCFNSKYHFNFLCV